MCVSVSISVSHRLLSLSTGRLVRPEIKVDEQEQVAGQERAAKHRGFFRPSTRNLSWHGGEERSELGVGWVPGEEEMRGCKVHDKEVDDELGDLHGGEVFLPPDPAATSCRVVVIVHEDVDDEVKNDRNPRNAGAAVQLDIAKKSCRRVVEDVKESKWFLLESEEDGIEQFHVFDVIVDDIVEFEFGSPRICATYTIKQTAFPDNWSDLLDHQREQQAASECQIHIVDLEEGVEFDGLAVSHELAQGEDDGEVEGDGRADLGGRREWRDTLLVGREEGGERVGDVGGDEICERHGNKGGTRKRRRKKRKSFG